MAIDSGDLVGTAAVGLGGLVLVGEDLAAGVENGTGALPVGAIGADAVGEMDGIGSIDAPDEPGGARSARPR